MHGQSRKVLLLVIDGLRPDAVSSEHMPELSALLRRGWRAGAAVTVRPSITVAALTSLATGVSPDRHGLRDTRLRSFSRIPGLRPLPLELRRFGIESSVVTPLLEGSARWLAGALLRLGGVTRLLPSPSAPGIMVDTALRQLAGNRNPEFVVVYLNDADLAGHAWGWMSPAYLHAVRQIDRALRMLVPLMDDPEVLTIVTADHGGGGVLAQDHDLPHPVNDAIPVGMLGGRVVPGLVSPEPVHLLDLPPTVLHAFGGTPPDDFEGRILYEAFHPELVSV